MKDVATDGSSGDGSVEYALVPDWVLETVSISIMFLCLLSARLKFEPRSRHIARLGKTSMPCEMSERSLPPTS